MDKIRAALAFLVAACLMGGCLNPNDHERDARRVPNPRVALSNTQTPSVSAMVVKAG